MTSDTPEFPWAAGSASGMGSMPGDDPRQAARAVFDELPELPYLPELPGRGPGADMIGRTAGLLTDLPVEVTPAGWRLAARPGRDLRRARDLLDRDLDSLEEVAQGYAGPLKVQAAGPWTLAAALELPASQEPALTDQGAVADIVASLAEGIAAHVKEVGARVPGATLLLQLDEPSLPAVLDGAVPSASGLRRLTAVEPGPAADALRTIFEAGEVYGLAHCCASGVPYITLMQSGARGIAFDLSLLRRDEEDLFAETAEAGIGLFAGVIQGVGTGRPQPAELARLIIDLWLRIGLPSARCAQQVVLTPACGLSGASPERATAVLAACHEAAAILPELIEEGTA